MLAGSRVPMFTSRCIHATACARLILNAARVRRSSAARFVVSATPMSSTGEPDPMTHFSVLELDNAWYAGSGLRTWNCSASASGRWEDVCLKAIAVAPSDARGRIDHRLLDHQPRGAGHSNGADSDEDLTP
jgi:hypothetical protein